MMLSLELMGLGLGGVFFALLILFFSVIILRRVFPHRERKEDGSDTTKNAD
jgi:Na+-transporting methylmalonyl-CoA/oxaloacetate decarboxylase gamma subunit